jgi:predicted nuclease with TOPRIM domain
MDMEQLALKLQETTDRSFRNEGRVKKLEGEHEVLQKLATSVAVMAEQIKTMNANVQSLTGKVDKLEEKPAKRWDGLVDKVIWAVAAALIGFALAQIGL